MRILSCRQGETAKIEEIDNGLIACQKAVGGLIEAYFISDTLAVVFNEEGRIRDEFLPNRIVSIRHTPTVIYGDFFFCGIDGDNFSDIDIHTAEIGLKLFNKPDFDEEGCAISDTGKAMEAMLNV